MIIKCPQCEKKFQIKDDVIAGKDQFKVKCAACKHIWTQSKHPETPKITQPDPSVQVYQAPTHRGKILWSLYLLIVLLVTLPMLVLMRYHVVALLPKTEMIYESLGLPVNTRTEFFLFEDLRFAKKTSEEGDTLILKGQIKYTPTQQEARTVPDVLVTVYGKSNCESQSWWEKKRFGKDPFQERGLCVIDQWSFSTKDSLALPGEIIRFEKEKFYKGEQIVPAEINLQFIDTLHGNPST